MEFQGMTSDRAIALLHDTGISGGNKSLIRDWIREADKLLTAWADKIAAIAPLKDQLAARDKQVLLQAEEIEELYERIDTLSLHDVEPGVIGLEAAVRLLSAAMTTHNTPEDRELYGDLAIYGDEAAQVLGAIAGLRTQAIEQEKKYRSAVQHLIAKLPDEAMAIDVAVQRLQQAQHVDGDREQALRGWAVYGTSATAMLELLLTLQEQLRIAQQKEEVTYGVEVPQDFPLGEAVRKLRKAGNIDRLKYRGDYDPVFGEVARFTADWLEAQHAMIARLQDRETISGALAKGQAEKIMRLEEQVQQLSAALGYLDAATADLSTHAAAITDVLGKIEVKVLSGNR